MQLHHCTRNQEPWDIVLGKDGSKIPQFILFFSANHLPGIAQFRITNDGQRYSQPISFRYMKGCQPGTYGDLRYILCETKLIGISGVVCIPCEPGYEQPLSDQEYCTPCQPGTYAEMNGTINCEHCPQNAISPRNSTSASLCSCIVNYYPRLDTNGNVVRYSCLHSAIFRRVFILFQKGVFDMSRRRSLSWWKIDAFCRQWILPITSQRYYFL
jgi:hypothetical protein